MGGLCHVGACFEALDESILTAPTVSFCIYFHHPNLAIGTMRSIFFSFLFRYEQQEIALNCGAMLRECLRYEALTKILLNSEEFYDFFKYVEVSTFDIASDAFATFKVITLFP